MAWFVPQDVEGLMELVGGQKSFEAHLDTLFTTSSELTGDPNAAADVTGMIGQYAHGNEPSHHIPYLYNYAGVPRKTQALVDHILRTLYIMILTGFPETRMLDKCLLVCIECYGILFVLSGPPGL